MPSMKNATESFMSNPLIIIVSLLLILIVILAVFRSATPFLNLGFQVNAHVGELKGSFQIEAFNNQSEDKYFVMYFAEWCGHCKRTKPEFEKLMSEYKGTIKILMIDAESDKNKELVKSQNISGFPTIRYYSSGINENFNDYDGGRTYSDFVQYLGTISGYPDKLPDNAAPVI
jgi:thiol-disulfide isomerase/thioredoxin